MRDVDQVIDLHTLLNPGATESSPIDCHICADLDIIIDLHNPNLRLFLMTTLFRFESKTVRPYDRTGVDDYARANLASFPDSDVRINKAVRADYRFMTDVTASSDDT